MMEIITVFITSLFAGLVQGVSGFGAVVILMVVLPYFETMKAAMSIAGVCAMPMNLTIIHRYRDKVRFRQAIGPMLFYFAGTTFFTHLASGVNLEAYKYLFGIFLFALALYFMFFSKKIKLENTFRNAVICMLVASITNSFFGISGPLMVLYYVAVLKDKEEYIGTMSALFFTGNLYSTFVRLYNGFFTTEMIPSMIAGSVGMVIGSIIGGQIVKHIDGAKVKKIVYAVLAVSGAITAVKGLL